MNQDQVKGRIDQAKGQVKQAAGKAVDNDRLKAEGLKDEAKGKTQAGFGDAKNKVARGIDKL